MALHLNLLHEEIAQERQRQRDPLKIALMVALFAGALMVAFYMWKGYEVLAVKSRLAAVQTDWEKVEPTVSSAQKRAKELNGIIATTKVLDRMVEGRFYWAPFMEKLSRCVAPNAQLTSIDGQVLENNAGISVTIEGIAAGREPRAAAEELRQLLVEQLAADYKNLKVEFKNLEDLDTMVNVLGANMAMARYVIGLTFEAPAQETAPAAPARRQKS
jgi:hypothetical protein